MYSVAEKSFILRIAFLPSEVCKRSQVQTRELLEKSARMRAKREIVVEISSDMLRGGKKIKPRIQAQELSHL